MALAGLARFNNDGRFMFPTQHAHTKTLRTARWKQGSGAEQTKVRTSNKNHRRAPARLRCVASSRFQTDPLLRCSLRLAGWFYYVCVSVWRCLSLSIRDSHWCAHNKRTMRVEWKKTRCIADAHMHQRSNARACSTHHRYWCVVWKFHIVRFSHSDKLAFKKGKNKLRHCRFCWLQFLNS